MGLDMYLSKKYYLFGKEREALKIEGVEGLEVSKVNEIVEEFGYWRKANAIHKWFVDNVQGGEDDCGDYHVTRKQLQELLSLVKTVIDNSKLVKGKIKNGTTYKDGKETINYIDGKFIKDSTIAKKLLPTTGGFFFGSYDYDEYYYQDLIDTKEILEKALQSKNGYFSYHSSW